MQSETINDKENIMGKQQRCNYMHLWKNQNPLTTCFLSSMNPKRISNSNNRSSGWIHYIKSLRKEVFFA